MEKGKLAWVVAILCAGLCALGGCAISDETKEKLEFVNEARVTYSVEKWSAICLARGKGAPRFSSKLFREIRKQGSNGPVGADGYEGPVVVVYCRGDTIPEAVTRALDSEPSETAKS